MRTYTIHRPDTVSVNLSLQPGNTQHMSQGPSVQLLFEYLANFALDKMSKTKMYLRD